MKSRPLRDPPDWVHAIARKLCADLTDDERRTLSADIAISAQLSKLPDDALVLVASQAFGEATEWQRLVLCELFNRLYPNWTEETALAAPCSEKTRGPRTPGR
jgi:hypothetical protein